MPAYFAAAVCRNKVTRDCKHDHVTIPDARDCARVLLHGVSSTHTWVELRRRDGADLTDAETAAVENLLG